MKSTTLVVKILLMYYFMILMLYTDFLKTEGFLSWLDDVAIEFCINLDQPWRLILKIEFSKAIFRVFIEFKKWPWIDQLVFFTICVRPDSGHQRCDDLWENLTIISAWPILFFSIIKHFHTGLFQLYFQYDLLMLQKRLTLLMLVYRSYKLTCMIP